MSDLLLRGRGADIGARAPVALIRLCGAALGIAIVQISASLGVVTALGVSSFAARVVLMIAGALLAPTAFGVWLWVSVGLFTTLLMLVSYTPLVVPLVPLFIRADAINNDPAPDAVVVLSGSVTSEGRVGGVALERLISGFQMARERHVPVVALSIVGDDGDETAATSERDQRELAQLMGPQMDVRFVRDVHSTRDEALMFAALARTNRWTRVVLVTSALHSKRACASLEQAGLAVECQPAVSRSYALSRLDRPENRRLFFGDVLYESAATVLYRLRGDTP